jgi:hypothetical protein
MTNGTTAIGSVLLLSTTAPIVAQAMLADEKILGLLLQLPAVAVVVWLLIQQNKDRNRRDGEQSAMLREMVAASVNSTKVMEDCAEAIRGNSAVIAELKRDQASIRDALAHQHSIIESLRNHSPYPTHQVRPGDGL